MTIDKAVELMELYTAPGRREHYTPEFVEAHEMAISALRAQQDVEKNDPLNQTQLGNMNGETVFCEELNAEVTVRAPKKGLIEIHYRTPGSLGTFFAKDVTYTAVFRNRNEN